LAVKIAVANQKGGTGKTTTSINLGACLAAMDKKVLLVDLDPQGNLSAGLNVVLGDGEPGAYEFLMGRVSPAGVVRNTDFPGLFVVPSHIELVAAEAELMGKIGREQQLRVALTGDACDSYQCQNQGAAVEGGSDGSRRGVRLYYCRYAAHPRGFEYQRSGGGRRSSYPGPAPGFRSGRWRQKTICKTTGCREW